MRIILPIERKLQSRPRFARRGNYVQTYEDSAMGAYKQKAKPELIEKGAIFAHITFYIATPKISLSSKKKRLEVKLERKYCDKKPDLDNYFKAVTEAAEGILYKNDGQIAVLVLKGTVGDREQVIDLISNRLIYVDDKIPLNKQGKLTIENMVMSIEQAYNDNELILALDLK